MKKYFIGSMAVIMAIAASAFNVNSSKKAAGDVFAFKNGTSTYVKLDNSYNPALCSSGTADTCAYEVTTAGASNITGTSFSQSQRDTYLANGWIERVSAASKAGNYAGN